jgi:hypothetical protein
MTLKQQNKLTILVKRFLDVFRIIFLALAVIWPITVLVVGLNIPTDPQERHTDVNVFVNFQIYTDLPAEQSAGSANEGELVLKGQGDILLNNTHGMSSWYLSGLINEVLLIIFLYGLLTMRKIFASLAEGSTFTEENAKRIRKIGYVFIGFHLVSPVLQYFGSKIMLQDIAFNTPGIHLYPGFEFGIGGVFAGFAIIVLSGVLREAASMQQEQSLTI